MTTKITEHAALRDGLTACGLSTWIEPCGGSLAAVDCDECLRTLAGLAYGDDLDVIDPEQVRRYVTALEYGEDALKTPRHAPLTADTDT
ncbi:hypothetical protein [Nocardiopsis sp. NRRL B-16309]|uniref:hypothetical protein n=1 Tax=Nocardiopsis sp. NRRL B-16309 TaxID=1519494 RepID=UPI0006ADB187|nr:hypothetical protein [Nocardiopsis sp. NRRL B-16309]KOX10172.1 hypothetical protein ADL05_26225 [Nocardiopsis sp. NRRL B-16309]